MVDPRTSIDIIRGFLASRELFPTPAVVEAAVVYAAEVEFASARMAACLDLLDRGLRTEAVHEASLDPAVQTQISRLSFPRREDWFSMAGANGLPILRPLPNERSERLNVASAEELALDGLLRSHRRLAIARASLDRRIGVLRRLAATDPQTPWWAEDLRGLEFARLDELRAPVEAAVRDNDDAEAARLYAELCSGGWSIPIPEELVEPLRTMAKRAARRESLRELNALDLRLSEAIAVGDLPLARSVQTSIRGLVERHRISPTGDIGRKLADSMARIDGLEAAAAKPVAFETVRPVSVPTPPAIPRREDDAPWNRREGAWPVMKPSRPILKFAGVLVACALAAGAIGELYRATQRASDRKQTRARLESEAAEDEVVHAERRRESAFAERLGALRTLPDGSDREGAMRREVETLALTTEDTEALAVLIVERDAVLTTIRDNDIKKLKRSWHDAAAKLAELRDRSRDDATSMSKTITAAVELEVTLRDLGRRSASLPQDLRSALPIRLAEVSDLLVELRSGLSSIESVGDLYRSMAGAIDDPARLSKAIEDARRTPLSATTKAGLDLTAQRMPAIAAAIGWREMSRGPFGRPFALEGAAARVETLEAFQKRHPRTGETGAMFPENLIERSTAQSHSLARRTAEYEALKTLFNRPEFADIRYVQTKRPTEWYYVEKSTETEIRDEQKNGTSRIDIYPITVSGTKARKSSFISPADVVSMTRAPHCLLADNLSIALSRIDTTNQWEVPLLGMLDMVLNDAECEPIIKLLFYRRILTSIVNGNSFAEKPLEAHTAWLTELKFDPTVNWTDCQSAATRSQQDRIRKTLIPGKPPSTGRVSAESTAAAIELQAQWEAYRREPFGVVQRISDTRQTIHTPIQPNRSGTLWVLAHRGDVCIGWTEIGKLQNGKILVSAPETLYSTQPVFLNVRP